MDFEYYIAAFIMALISFVFIVGREAEGKLTVGTVLIALLVTFTPILNCFIALVIGGLSLLGGLIAVCEINISRRK